jgi:hypothetical protein
MNGQQITNDEYHSQAGMSATGLKTFLKSPAHYKAAQENNEDTPAFRTGRMIHSGVLEPETFYYQYAVFEGDRRTKVGKEDWQAIMDEGKEPIKADELEIIEGCQVATLGMFPIGGQAELSFSTVIDGVKCRCRPDWLVEDPGVYRIYDLKTCQSVEGIDSLFYKYGYHIQQVFYCTVLESLGMTVDREMQFIFVEKKPPFDVVVRTMDMALYDATEVIIRNALQRYKTCLETDQWPGIEPERTLKQAVCPAWIAERMNPEIDWTEFYAEGGEDRCRTGIDLNEFYSSDNAAC